MEKVKLLKVGEGKYINLDRVTYIEARKKGKVAIQFQSEVSCGGIGIPASYLELEGNEAVEFLRWLEVNADTMG